MIRVVQIGTVPVWKMLPRNGGFSFDMSSKSSPQIMTDSTGFILGDDYYNQGQRSLKADFILYDNDGQRDRYLRELEYAVGSKVNAYGYIPVKTKFETRAIWMHNTAFIRNIKRRGNKDNELSITLELELLSAWQPTNRLYYRWSDADPYDVYEYDGISFANLAWFPYSSRNFTSAPKASFEIEMTAGGSFLNLASKYGFFTYRFVFDPTAIETARLGYFGVVFPHDRNRIELPDFDAVTEYTLTLWVKAIDLSGGDEIDIEVTNEIDGLLVSQPITLIPEYQKVVLPSFVSNHPSVTIDFVKGFALGSLAIQTTGFNLAFSHYDRLNTITPIPNGQAIQSHYPVLSDLKNISGFQWVERLQRQGRNVLYNPDNWLALVNNLNNDYGNIGQVIDWRSDFTQIVVYYDEAIFNFRPLVIFAFRDIRAGAGTLPEIIVQREDGSVSVTRIDMDTVLSSGFYFDDDEPILIIGEVTGRAVLMVDETIRAYTSDALVTSSNYDQSSPGAIVGNNNRIAVDAKGMEYTVLILWRAI